MALTLALGACVSPSPDTEQAEAGPGTAPKSRYAVEHDFAPLRPITPEEVVDATPRAEPILAAGNMSPYVIGGITYEVTGPFRGAKAKAEAAAGSTTTVPSPVDTLGEAGGTDERSGSGSDDDNTPLLIGGGVVVVAAAAGGLIAVRRRRNAEGDPTL